MHGYPPDKQEKATLTVLEQVEVLSEGWDAVSMHSILVCSLASKRDAIRRGDG